MSLLNWVPGRRGGGYRKLCLAQGARWDLYLIDYPPGTGVTGHTDPVPGFHHWRLNVTLLGNPLQFVPFRWPPDNDKDISYTAGWRVVLFRPDRVRHMVFPGSKRRMVLSLGWVVRDWKDSLERLGALDPDANCITTPDGGCVGGPCMHNPLEQPA